tara:strand:- start:126 stop:365 length:240 start_codon:yes stop_codon:yes gene_type:complete
LPNNLITRVRGTHSLAPDSIVVLYDPWGSIRTYAKFGKWSIETETFDTGYCCSTDKDKIRAVQYARHWALTGKEKTNIE